MTDAQLGMLIFGIPLVTLVVSMVIDFVKETDVS